MIELCDRLLGVSQPCGCTSMLHAHWLIRLQLTSVCKHLLCTFHRYVAPGVASIEHP
jgi:hypothetical protein